MFFSILLRTDLTGYIFVFVSLSVILLLCVALCGRRGRALLALPAVPLVRKTKIFEVEVGDKVPVQRGLALPNGPRQLILGLDNGHNGGRGIGCLLHDAHVERHSTRTRTRTIERSF